MTVYREYPAAMSDFHITGNISSDVGPSGSLLTYFEEYYITPHGRCGPYIVGILAGYILAVNGGKIKLNRITNILGWLVTVATGLAIVYGLRGSLGGESPLPVGVTALYNGFSRTAWGMCICWVMFSCVSGYGGVVNRLLSWPTFEVLGRLTYMVYLIHLSIIQTFYENMDQAFFTKDLTMTVFYLGLLTLSYMAAFVLSVMLESPTQALEKIFLR